MSVPKLIVFDLDFTLWDCGGLWVDCTSYPFETLPNGTIVDRENRGMRLYEEVTDILDHVDQLGIPMALASRTGRPDWARDLLDRFEIRKRFAFEEIFPSSKVQHFSRLNADSGYEFEEMLFFDDERRNIVDVGALGVKCVEVSRGVDDSSFRSGMELFETET
ncbi:MAG: magnesium-dependent phosphatase-1 [Verrucomicrobiales bacterium]|nr:magnesium-dependent phosphatase-1 [Verrucomicrobiales bacterium]